MATENANKHGSETAHGVTSELRSTAWLGHCVDCKWWGNQEDKAEAKRLRRCNHPKTFYGYGVNDEEVPDDGWHCEDDEGWGCRMAGNFGCINHEAA